MTRHMILTRIKECRKEIERLKEKIMLLESKIKEAKP